MKYKHCGFGVHSYVVDKAIEKDVDKYKLVWLSPYESRNLEKQGKLGVTDRPEAKKRMWCVWLLA